MGENLVSKLKRVKAISWIVGHLSWHIMAMRCPNWKSCVFLYCWWDRMNRAIHSIRHWKSKRSRSRSIFQVTRTLAIWKSAKWSFAKSDGIVYPVCWPCHLSERWFYFGCFRCFPDYHLNQPRDQPHQMAAAKNRQTSKGLMLQVTTPLEPFVRFTPTKCTKFPSTSSYQQPRKTGCPRTGWNILRAWQSLDLFPYTPVN